MLLAYAAMPRCHAEKVSSSICFMIVQAYVGCYQLDTCPSHYTLSMFYKNVCIGCPFQVDVTTVDL